MNDLLIFLSATLVNNFVLVQFLGLCPFIGITKKIETAIGMGIATTFVITVTTILSWLVDQLILIPLKLNYLRILVFILIISVVVQFTEIMIRTIHPLLYRIFGIFLPLITTNCAVLSVSLLNSNYDRSFFQSALYGFSAAIGFSIFVILFASLRERLVNSDIPKPFRGNSIIMITAGLMSLAFTGFNGLVKIS